MEAEIRFPRYDSYRNSGADWLGEIPAHWNVKKTKFLWREQEQRSLDGKEQLLSVSQYYGVVPKKDDSRSESLVDYKKCGKQNLVINIMLAWLGGLGVTDHDGIVSPAYCVYRQLEDNSAYYLNYLYRTPVYLAEFARRSKGVVPSRWRMYTEELGQVLTLLPPRNEQNRIANFLDKKTTEIDKAIAKKQRLIELLKEQKAILINQAVTRGLNPDALMRDSGVEWIGEVPEHWNIKRIGFLADLIQTGPFGSQLHQEEYIQGSIPVINPSQLSNGTIIPDEKTTVSDKTASRLARHKIQIGDIIFARRGEMGRCGLTLPGQEGFICGTGSLLFRPNRLANPKFLSIALSCDFIKKNLEYVSVGATMDNLNTKILSKVSLPLPPKFEQNIIIEATSQVEEEFSLAILLQLEIIQYFEEYKQTIISNAVTGKIKI